MTFIHNWRDVLRKAWSIRFLAVATLLQFAEAALGYFDGIPTWLTLAVLAAALVSRLVAQEGLTGAKDE